MTRLVHVLTVPESLRFLRGQPAFMRERGIETHVITSPGALLDRFAREEGVEVHPLPMTRAITPRQDLIALARLTALLSKLRPDIVHAHTPKGGLLGTMAARAARVPRVLYHMRGLPFMGREGVKRRVLMATERVSCGLADTVICQSRSLREVAIEHRLVDPRKALVLGPGGNGVDLRRFDPDGPARDRASDIRKNLGIPESARVVGFVGRLVRDKGIVELEEAWRELRARFADARLLLVGPWEDEDPVPAQTRRALEQDERVHLAGETEDVAPYYLLMDVLALPTYREGFPNVPVEAAAMRVPVVATRIPGCVDAVVDGVTGTLVPPRDATSLADALGRYLAGPELREQQARAARERVERELSRERAHAALHALYVSADSPPQSSTEPRRRSEFARDRRGASSPPSRLE